MPTLPQGEYEADVATLFQQHVCEEISLLDPLAPPEERARCESLDLALTQVLSPPALAIGPNRRFQIVDLPLICPCRDPGSGVSTRVNLKSKIDDLVPHPGSI
jgi:hypothetical protein